MPEKYFDSKEEKRFSLIKNSFLSLCLTLFITLGLSLTLKAQRTGPEQQPCNAISLNCAPVFHTNDAYTGTLTSAIGGPYFCYKQNGIIYNPVFFKFTAQANGTFKFKITPNAPADYDYWFADITGKPNSCDWESMFYTPTGTNTYSVSDQCNTYASWGVTGATQTSPSSCDWPSSCPEGKTFAVIQGRQYLLLVSYYGDAGPVVYPEDNIGFTLDATTTTAGVLTKPTPTFTFTNKICVGSAATFAITNPDPAAIYTWSGSNLSATTGTTVSASPTTIGNNSYTLTVTYPGTNCPPYTTTFIVVVVPKITITASASPARICRGQSVTLSASGAPVGSTYIWNGPGLPTDYIGASVSVTPTVGMGTTIDYTVRAVSPGIPCEDTRTVRVTVDDPIAVSISANPGTTVCAGQPLTLTATGNNPNLKFTWMLTPGPSVIGSTVTVYPTSTQSYLVGAYLPGSVCPIDEVYSNINILVADPFNLTASASPSRFCLGGQSTLTASGGPAGTVYTWSGYGLLSSAGSSVVAKPDISGTFNYTVTATVPGSLCPPKTYTVTIIVDKPVAYSLSATNQYLCLGNSVTLTANSADANMSYIWSGPGLPPTSATSVTVTPTVTTTYTVSGNSTNNTCGSVIKTITIYVTPPITFTLSYSRPKICLGEPITITANGAPAGTVFYWGSLGTVIFTTTPTSVTFIPTSTNITYYVTASLANSGCPAVTKNFTIPIDVPFAIDVTSSPANICPGASATLSATGLSANTVFTWNGGSLVNASGASHMVNPGASTAYEVTVKDPSNECTVKKGVSVSVNQAPAVSLNGGDGSCDHVSDLCATVTADQLSAGDLAIIRYRFDPVDEFVFVPLVNLPAGTVINFTDRGWNGTSFVNNTGDNVYTYTAPTNIAAGTIITLSAATYGFDFSDLGDQVLMYQGSDAAPKFIYGLSSTMWLTTGAVTPTTSYLPSGLVNNYTALDFPLERDNGKFCPAPGTAMVISGAPSLILNQIGRVDKWLAGSTVTLNANDPVGVNANWQFIITPAATQYGLLWNTGATTNCIANSSAGIYTATYTDLHGCVGSASKTTVNPFDIAPEWSTYFGPDFEISDIKISPTTGNVIVCGTLNVSGATVPAPVNAANVRNYGESSLTSPSGVDYYRTVVAEVSKNGNEVLWVDYVNTKSWSGNSKLEIDVNGDIYVGIVYTGDPAFQPGVLKLNDQGVQQWLVKDFITVYTANQGLNLTATADGVYMIFTAECVNTFPSAVNACQGLTSAATMKLSKVNGAPVWTSFFGGTGGAYTRSHGYDLTHDNLGNIYFTGDAAGMPGVNSLSLLPPISTYSTATIQYDGNPVIVKMNSAGAVVWWDLLSEANSPENNYTAGIAVKNNHLYTSNFSGMEWGPSSFNEQVIHRRDATTGSLLFSKTLTIDYTVQPLLDNLFRVYDLTVDAQENVYLTGDLAYASLSLIMPGAADYHNAITTPSPRQHGDLETFVLCFSGQNLNPKWYTYYGVDPAIATRYSNYQNMQYMTRGVVTDGLGGTYIAGMCTGDYDHFEVVDQSVGTPVVDGSNPSSRKGIITKFTCEASQQVPQPRMRDNASAIATSIAYPNPFTTSTKLEVNGQTGELCDISVYSMEGVEVFKRQNVASGQALEIGEGLPAGMYFVNVRGSLGTNTSVKIIKR